MQNVGFHVVFAVSVHIAGHIGGAKVAGKLSVQNVGIAYNVVLLRQSLHDQDLLDHALLGAFAVFQVFIHTAVTGLAQHGLQRNAAHLGVQVRLVQHGIGEILLHIFGQGIGIDFGSIVQLAVQLIGFLIEQQAVADKSFQLSHIVHAHGLGQVAADPIISQVGGHILVDVVQRGGEHCVLAGQVGGLVVIREGDIHIKGFAGHVANDLILEAVNKGAAAQGQIIIAAGAAVKGNAVYGTGKVNVNRVTDLGGAVGALVGGLIVGDNDVGKVIVKSLIEQQAVEGKNNKYKVHLFNDVSEVKEPGECGGLYTGEYEKEGFIGTYMLHNQALKSEHIMISCVNNLVNPGQQLALVSGLSNYTMLPVTFKAVISEKEIVNKEKLMNLLAFNKEDLKLMKQMNYLTIQNMR